MDVADAYGRHRESIADIEERLRDIVEHHPLVSTSPEGEPCVPSAYMGEIFRQFQDSFGGQLVDDNELALMADFVANSPSIEVVTPSMLLMFVAQKTGGSPPAVSPTENAVDDQDPHAPRSRTSSSGSNQSSYAARPSSRGPPQTPKNSSFFDKRQRSTPLGPTNNAPSSWSRPAPRRRKSDAGSRSDSEYSASPTAFGRSGRRSRAPSNPTSPSYDNMSPPGSARSPHFFGSRPGSRTGNYNGYSSPDESYDPNDSIMHSISSLSMPTHDDHDSDENNSDDDTMGLVHDRRVSTISLEPLDKVDILQKTNDDLHRKLMEAERTLQQRMSEHENELEELQTRLDEVKSELSATKREEKELRSKERINQSQISELESEVNKLNRQLDTSRATYSNLNRLFQEQVEASEHYRNELRERERDVAALRDAASLHDLEAERFAKEQAQAEDRIHRLEVELEVAAHAQEELDQQKQENLLLKETIDRMKFDLDELRNKDHWNASSGRNSAAPTISKSLGAELSAKLKDGMWDMDDDQDDETQVEEESEETEGDDDEDVVQTIITRKKRKVASRANQLEKIETRTFEEVKEYSDSSTQYDPTPFLRTSSTQTDPEPKVITASATIQTEDASVSTFAVQTDPEPEPEPVPVPATSEMEIQTDDLPEEEDAGPSSSAAETSTPKPEPPELPPAYGEEPDMRLAMETLRQWHEGAKIPGGKNLRLSPEFAAEWRALKEELGFGCKVIDDTVEASTSTSDAGSSAAKGKRRSSKFYNIYNTYVYDKSSPIPYVTQAFIWTAGAALLMYMNLHLTYPHPGAATLHDRYAWQSFNSIGAAGEGFGGAMDALGNDGQSSSGALWSFLGRVGGGAARIARGWPT